MQSSTPEQHQLRTGTLFIYTQILQFWHSKFTILILKVYHFDTESLPFWQSHFTILTLKFYHYDTKSLLCILTSLRVRHLTQSWLNYFFQLFSTFFVHFKPFQWFCTWNHWKRLKTAKKVVRPAFRCMQHPKTGQNTQQKFTILTNVETRTGLVKLNFISRDTWFNIWFS